MISPEELKRATDFIIFTLNEQQLSENTVKVYSLHYHELNAYIKDKALVEIDDTTLLEFLRFRFDIQIASLYTKRVGESVGKHIKPFSVLSWYLATGIVDRRARMRNPPYECPAGFVDSYKGFIHHMRVKELACKIFLISAAVAAVFWLAVDDIADDAVDLVWLLHQRRVAAACAKTGCDCWTDLAGFPDTGINTMVLIYQGLMSLFAGAERTGHIFTHIHPLSTLIVQAHNRRHTVAAWTALERWGNFLCVADGSSCRAGASGKRRGKCLLHS